MDLHIENCDFTYFFVCLPEGNLAGAMTSVATSLQMLGLLSEGSDTQLTHTSNVVNNNDVVVGIRLSGKQDGYP